MRRATHVVTLLYGFCAYGHGMFLDPSLDGLLLAKEWVHVHCGHKVIMNAFGHSLACNPRHGRMH
jgi:hypothetical protein